MIKRNGYIEYLKKAIGHSRDVALLGPRQSGKTTLARELVDSHSPNYFDLEDQSSVIALVDPKSVLEPLKGVIVIDKVQERPELFPILRVLLDRQPLPAKFSILGSAPQAFLRQSSESLAGRLELVEMGGFDITEVGAKKEFQLC